jgi:hypothetical protein
MFQDVEQTYEFIFCTLSIEKSHMEEVPYVMFPVGKWPWELIVCLLDVLKNDFCEVEEAMYESVEWQLNLLS